MPWPESLTTAQQNLIQNWIDQEFRPATLLVVKALSNIYNAALPAYLASPTGLASTFASPATDSIAGLLATLPAGDVIPFAAGQNATGLGLALPLTVGEVITYGGGLNAMMATYYVTAALQAWSNIVGAVNLH